MTEAELVEAITEQFATAFAASRPALASLIALEGESFEAEDTWVRLSIVPSDGDTRSMGPPGERLIGDTGFVTVQVFSPIGAGVIARAALCDDVRAALQFQSLGASGERVRIFRGVSRNPTTDGRWMMQLVVFAYDCMSQA